MTNLNDKSIRGLPVIPGKQYAVSDGGNGAVRGLSVLISPGGSKVFYFRYKTPARKSKRLKIGSYPGTSLSDARRKAREFKKELDEGGDLIASRSRKLLLERNIHTVGELWAEYHIDALPRKKSAKFENQLWHKHLDSYFGQLDIRSFTRDMILDFLVPYRRKNSPALGARIQAIISQLGAYAVERRVLQFSPAYQLGKKKPLPTCDRFLSRYELAVFWNALSDKNIMASAKVSPSLSICLKLILCSCARRGEVVGMEWGEIDYVNKNWIIPAERTKNGRTHIVPLSGLILDLLSEARDVSHKPNSKFVFPGRRSENITKGAGHVRRDAPTRACSRVCDVLIAEYEIEKFTPHDLRRTSATYMAGDLKIDRFTISQILNHTNDYGGGSAVTGIYARYDYLDEKRNAISAWNDYVQRNALSFQTLLSA